MDTVSMLNCKDRLQQQLQKAKESLKGVDDNLKKFVSRTTSEAPLRSTFNKSTSHTNDKWKNSKDESFSVNSRRRPARVLNDANIENIPVKKRLGPKVLHSSISGPPRKSEDFDSENHTRKPAVLSCVIAKPHALPSRKEAVSVKTYTETRARDRRMFGALLGTLQKFRQEETQLKDKEDKKAKVEKKLEEAARREKEKLRLERQKLIDIRKKKESYIKAVENNMKLVKEQEQWEELQRPLFNYIRTDSNPSICYLPKIHNEKTQKLLEDSRSKLTKLIEEKRENVKEEVDTLISQWKNVDLGDMMVDENVSSLRDSSADHFDDRNDLSEDNEPPFNDSDAANEACSVDDIEKSKNFPIACENDTLHSAKEQRLKTKSGTDHVLVVKEEKEDDYDASVSVKLEKGTLITATTTTVDECNPGQCNDDNDDDDDDDDDDMQDTRGCQSSMEVSLQEQDIAAEKLIGIDESDDNDVA